MKNIFLAILLIFSFVFRVCSQTSPVKQVNSLDKNSIVTDTIGYLRNNIVGHKEKFQYKELNFLLDELHLTIKSYSFSLGLKSDKPFRSIIVFFEDSKMVSEKAQKRGRQSFLIITFENDISQKDVWKLYMKNDGAWTSSEKDFFGKLIVADITTHKIDKK